ncbi:MAG: hypothetical protein ACLP9S_04560 [Syntrophales bacterium]
MKPEDRVIDSRLVGATAEHLFLSLVNQQGVFATSFNTAGFDGIAFDPKHKIFKVGDSPFYVQIKCRGSKHSDYSAQGHSKTTINKIIRLAKRLGIPAKSLYFVVGFFKEHDIRKIRFFIIPFASLRHFEKTSTRQYRFSVKACDEVRRKKDKKIVVL